VLKSGVHATLAGVAVGFCIPLKSKKNPDYSPLRALEQALHPWVAFLILPVFVFVNADITFGDVGLAKTLASTVTLGIVLGLFLGKSIGVFSFAWATIKCKLANKPNHANWGQIWGVSTLTGIGFTMSFFLSTLAFYGSELTELAKRGVIAGTLLSGILGVIIILIAGRGRRYARYDVDAPERTKGL